MIDVCNYCRHDNDDIDSREHCENCLSLESQGKLPNEFELKDSLKELVKMLEGAEE